MFDYKSNEMTIFDQADMGELLRGGSVTPWMCLEVGVGNILESEPLSAVRIGSTIDVECRTAKVTLDLHEETAMKTGSDGRAMIYVGGIEEANSGRGWIPAD